MKKTLIAAALLAGFSGVAQAETQVTLYGIVDAGIGFQKITGANGESSSKIGVASGGQSGSRWGMRGTEDLGDGLKAVFTLESGFNVQTGRHTQSDRLFGRQSTIGLANASWGQFDFGRQTNIGSKYFSPIDPFSAGMGQANIGAAFGSLNTMRLDNQVQFQTANFSGFQAGIGYSFGANGYDNFSTNENQRELNAGVRYANGPVNVALVYDQLNQISSTEQDKVRSWNLGGTYDFEVVKVAAAFGQTRDGWFLGQSLSPFESAPGNATGFPSMKSIAGLRVNSYMVGATLPIGGASNLFGSWMRADPNSTPINVGKGEGATIDTFSLGYTYDLSKRTNLYAVGSYAKNYAFVQDQKSTVGLVGVRHRF